MVITLIFANLEEDVDDQNTNGSEKTFYSVDYGAILTSASAEIVGTAFAILSIDRVGRIPIQVGSAVVGGCMVFAFCLLASYESPSRTAMVITAFLARMAMMAGGCTTWVTTAEVLTTEFRATGHSASNATGRVGGAAGLYLSTWTTNYQLIGTVLLVLSLVSSLAVSWLPETNGKPLGQVTTKDVDDSENHSQDANSSPLCANNETTYSKVLV
jgi:MFS family permease